jgi:hypothetical protein
MATITTVKGLLPLCGSVATADDPVAALEQRGHCLSPALKARLRPHRTPTDAQRRLWNKGQRKPAL